MRFYDGVKEAKMTASDLQNGLRMGNKNAEINRNFYGVKD